LTLVAVIVAFELPEDAAEVAVGSVIRATDVEADAP
jgi:hypothetical protein